MQFIFWILIYGFIFGFAEEDDFFYKEKMTHKQISRDRIVKFEGLLKEFRQEIQSKIGDFERPYTLVKIGLDNLGILPDFQDKKATKVLFHENSAPFSEDFDVILPLPKSKEDLNRLSDCEFFDVVIVTNLVYSLEDDWASKLQKIISMGYLTFIVVPPKFINHNIDMAEIQRFIPKGIDFEILKTDVMQRFQSKVILCKQERKRLLTNHILGKKKELISYEIFANKKEATFKKIFLENGVVNHSLFLPGINLLTFLYFDGSKPSSNDLKKNLMQIRYQRHSDFMPHNMIINNKGLFLIDFGDWRCSMPKEESNRSYIDKNRLDILFKMIDSRQKKFLEEKILGGF